MGRVEGVGTVATARPKYVLRVVGHVDGFTVAKAIIELYETAGIKLPNGERPTIEALASYLNVSESTARRLYRSTLRTDGNTGRAAMRLGTVPDGETADRMRKLVESGYRKCAFKYGKKTVRALTRDSDTGRVYEAVEVLVRARLLKDLAYQHFWFFAALKRASQQIG